MFSKNISAFFIMFKGHHGESANLTKLEFLAHTKNDDAHCSSTDLCRGATKAGTGEKEYNI